MKPLIVFVILIITGCKSNGIYVEKYKINSGTILYESCIDLSDYNAEEKLERFVKFQNAIFEDTLLKTSKFHELSGTTEDSILASPYFDKKGVPNIKFIKKLDTDTTLLKLIITRDELFLPSYQRTLEGNDKFYDFGTKIVRDRLNRCFSNINRSCRTLRPIKYLNESFFDYKIMRRKKKNILGYNCFLVRVKSTINPSRYYDLYVTDKIRLKYDPLFNLKSLTDRGFFVLEKIYFNTQSKRITRAKSIEIK